MSMPNIPDITPKITIDAEQCEAMLLASIALEEMGLAHILNAEGEKIQYILGTLPDIKPVSPPSIDQLLQVNSSVCDMLRMTANNQMLLSNKLSDIIELYNTLG